MRPSWRSWGKCKCCKASLLEREVDGLLHEEVSIADIPLVQHGVCLDGGHARGVLDLQRGRAVNCRMQQHMQGTQPAVAAQRKPAR